MNIQAIETQYKGYKFRSRLEARWAVFFDQLGIKWQYEVEGFKLPSGYFLPDFYLPGQDCYVEVKAPHLRPFLGSSMPRVYMAGRMKEPCWRPFSVYGDYYACDEKMISPVGKAFDGHHIIYTGPFRTGLDNHSPLHGLDCAAYCYEPEVFKRSIFGIKACEVFFAYFDDLEAYGTLVEVGMAHALGKRIVVGLTDQDVPERWDIHNHGEDPECGSNDLWFAANCAEKVLAGNKDDVLAEFGNWLDKNYPMPREVRSAHELSRGKTSSVCLFYGDPVEAVATAIWWRRFPLDAFPKGSIEAAALKARQARFEHGQSGASKN